MRLLFVNVVEPLQRRVDKGNILLYKFNRWALPGETREIAAGAGAPPVTGSPGGNRASGIPPFSEKFETGLLSH